MVKKQKPPTGAFANLLQANFLYERLITILVFALEVVQVSTTVCDHLEKSTAGMVILVVFLQMGRQFVD